MRNSFKNIFKKGTRSNALLACMLSFVLCISMMPVASADEIAQAAGNVVESVSKSSGEAAKEAGSADRADASASSSSGSVGEDAAVEAAITYDVAYEPNGATAGSMKDSEVTSMGESHLLKNAYARDGYEFAGWSTTADAKDAKNEKGEVVTRAITVPDDTVLDSLTFTYDANEDGKDETYSLASYVDEGVITLYAQWNKVETESASSATDDANQPEDQSSESAEKTAEGEAVAEGDSATDGTEEAAGEDASEGTPANSAEDDAAPAAAESSPAKPMLALMSRLLAAVPAKAPAANVSPSDDGSFVEFLTTRWVTDGYSDREVDANKNLTITPKDNASEVKATFAVDYSLSGGYNYQPGEIVLRVSAHIVKDRNGNWATVTPAVPSKDDVGSAMYYYEYDDSTNEFVIKNNTQVSAASNTTIEFEIKGDFPSMMVGNTPSDDINSSIRVKTQNGRTIGCDADPINMTLATEAKVQETTKAQVRIYDSWKDSWTDETRPANPGDYIYVEYDATVKPTSNTVQGYTVTLTDEITDSFRGAVLGYSEFMSAQTDSQRNVPYEGAFHADAPSKTFDSISSDWDDEATSPKIAEMSCARILVAYPKSSFPNTDSYTLADTVTGTITGLDDRTPDSKTASITSTYANLDFVPPDGTIPLSLQKSVPAAGSRQSTDAYFNFLEAGDTVHSNTYFVTAGADAYYYTYDGAESERGSATEEAYGKKSYTVSAIDDMVFLGSDLTQALTSDDYYVSDAILYVPKAREYGNAGSEFGFYDSAEQYAGTTTLYGNTDNGEWVALVSITSDADGNVTYQNLSPDTVTRVSLSGVTLSIQLAESANYTGTKAETTTTDPGVRVNYEVKHAIKPTSETIKKALEEARRANPNNPKVTLFNVATNKTVAEDGTLIGAKSGAGPDGTSSDAIDRMDNDRYHESMYHKAATTDIVTYLANPSTSKTVGDIENNMSTRNIKIPYTVRYNNGVTNQAIDDGIATQLNEGTFYDLLPAGVNVDVSTIKVSNGGLKNDDGSYKYPGIVTNTEVVPNYNGTGRSLLKVSYTHDESDKSYWISPELVFDAYYDWNSKADYGADLHNVAAFETDTYVGEGDDAKAFLGTDYKSKNGDIINYGYPDDPTSGEGFLSAGAHSADGRQSDWSDKEKDAMKGLDSRDGDKAKRFAYMESNLKLNEISTSESSMSKTVKAADGTTWGSGQAPDNVDVSAGGAYTYRLRMQSPTDSTTEDLIFFDSLENYSLQRYDKDYKGRKIWHGNFESVDLTQARAMGADPVVYYSTYANLKFSYNDTTGQTLSGTRDLTNTKFWHKLPEGELKDEFKASITAIAIDMRYSNAETQEKFVLGAGQSVSTYVNMKAPTGFDAFNFYRQKAHAFNQIYMYSTITPATGEPSTSTIHNEYTKVGLRAGQVKLDKTVTDSRYKNETFYFQVTNDGKTTQTVTIKTPSTEHEGEWDTTTMEVPLEFDYKLYNDDGTIVRTDDGREVRHNGVAHEVQKVDEDGSLVYDEDGNPVYEQEMNEDGTPKTDDQGNPIYVMTQPDSTGGKISMLASQYIVISALDAKMWQIQELDGEGDDDLWDESNRVQPAGYASGDITNEFSSSISKTTTIDFRNKRRTGELEISKTVQGGTDKTQGKRFSFTPEFYYETVDAETRETTKTPSTDSYLYDIYTGETKVGSAYVSSGGTITLQDGQRAVIRQLPKGIKYSVTEAEAEGFETVAEGAEGEITEEGQTYNADFTNTYNPKGTLEIQGNKTFTPDGDLQKNQFAFILMNENNEPLYIDHETGKATTVVEGNEQLIAYNVVDDQGEFTFPAISYDTSDIGSTYVYRIRELRTAEELNNEDGTAKTEAAPYDPAMNYDSHVETVLVTISDDGKGKLTAVTTFDADGVVLHNQKTPGNLELSKAITGDGADPNQEFTYHITFTDDNGNPISGTYSYTLDEVSSTASNARAALAAMRPTTLMSARMLAAPAKAPASTSSEPYHATNLEGTAYAVLDADGTLHFVRSNNTYTNKAQATVTTIDGASVKGTVYTGVEAQAGAYPTWYNSAGNLEIVKVSFDNDIKPVSTSGWFYHMHNLAEIEGMNDHLDTSLTTTMRYMFDRADGLKKIDVSTFSTAVLTDARDMFRTTNGLEELDLGNFDTSRANTKYMFSNSSLLRKITFGPDFKFKGSGTDSGTTSLNNGGKTADGYLAGWMYSTDNTVYYESGAAFASAVDNGTAKAGTWEWRTPTTPRYTIAYDKNTGNGSMGSQGPLDVGQPAKLANNSFTKFGYEFLGWATDPNAMTPQYLDGDTIPVETTATYSDGQTVTLYAVWKQEEKSIEPGPDGYTITLKGGQKATFENLPAGVHYKIVEEPVNDWVIDSKTNDTGDIPADDTAKASFRNKYKPDTVTAQLSAAKTVDGVASHNTAFRFELYDSANVLLQTQNLGVDGTIAFDPVELSVQTGQTVTQIYTIKEVALGDDTYQYDGNVYYASVTASKKQGEAATVTVEYRKSDRTTVVDNVVFENTTSKGALEIAKTVATEGAPDDEFTFTVDLKDKNQATLMGSYTYTITDAAGAEVSTGSVASGGTIRLRAGQKAHIDGLPIHTTYTVTETTASSNWVNTSKTGDAGEIAQNNDVKTAEFTNIYVEPVTAQVEATKQLDGRNWLDSDEFRFSLKPDTDGAPMPAGVSGEAAAVATKDAQTAQFGTIEFSREDLKNADGSFATSKTFEYELTEVTGSDTAMTYSDDKVKVTVELAYVDGKLATAVKYNGETGTHTFTNTYQKQPVTAQIQAQKVLQGRTWQASDSFSFTLRPGKSAPLPENTQATVTSATPNHLATFDEVTYNAEGTYIYYIKENVPDGATETTVDGKTYYTKNGITYASADHQATVTVTDADNDGQLEAKVTYYGESTTPPEFTNIYNAKPVDLPLAGQKTMNGRALHSGGYSFEALPADRNFNIVKDAEGKETVAANGSVQGSTDAKAGETKEFESAPLTFTQTGTYYYVMREVVPAEAKNADGITYGDATDEQKAEGGFAKNGITYDGHYTHVTVTVTDNLNGTLKAVASYDNASAPSAKDAAKTDTAAFTNTYDSTGTATLDVTKTIKNRAWNDTESYQFTLVGVTEGAPLPEAAGQSATATKAGPQATFGDITYTRANLANGDGTYADRKDFVYKIAEVEPAAADKVPGITYNTTPIYAKVTVTDEGNGSIATEVAYFSDVACAQALEASKIENEYTAEPTTATIQVQKNLTGRDWAEGETFSFKLTATRDVVPLPDEAGRTATTTSQMTPANFGDITYTLADLGGNQEAEFFYVIEEIKPAEADGAVYTYGNDSEVTSVTYKGISYDVTTHRVKVTVKDNGDGTLSAEVKYHGGEDTVVPHFTNEYTAAPAKIALAGGKKMVNRELRDAMYSFTLTDQNQDLPDGTSNPKFGQVIDNATTDPATTEDPHTGTFEGHELTFTSAGTYWYTSNEVVPDDATKGGKTYADATAAEKEAGGFVKDGVTYDSRTRVIRIDVTDDGVGALHAEATVLKANDDGSVNTQATEEDTNVYTNEYNASGAVKLAVDKAISGREWKDNESYSFQVVGNDDASTAKLPENTTATTAGAVDANKYKAAKFDAMQFDVNDIGKEFSFTITETTPSGNGITKDDKSVTAKVAVADGGDGTLAFTVTYDGATTVPVFTNTYEAKGSIQLKATKTVTSSTGEEYDLPLSSFKFQLYDGENQAIGEAVAADTNGNVTFPKINYTLTAENRKELLSSDRLYYIKEVVPADDQKVAGITYDESSHSVSVKITDNGNGELTCTPTYAKDRTSAEFENLYNANGATALHVSKTLEGRPIVAAGFSFELIDNNSTSATYNQVIRDATVVPKTSGDYTGSAAFKPLDYTTVGTYKYIVREVNNDRGGIKYDAIDHPVTVEVTDDDHDGVLETAVTYDNSGEPNAEDKAVTNSAAFRNSYAATGAATATATKKITGRGWQDGDSYTFGITLTPEGDAPMPEGKTEITGTVTDDSDSDANENKSTTIEGLVYDISDLTKYDTERGRKYDDFTYLLTEHIPNEALAYGNGAKVDPALSYGDASDDQKAAYDWRLDGIQYAKGTHTVHVHVEDTTTGKLETTVTYDDGTTEAPVFENTYIPDGTTGTVQASKNLTGRDWKDGDSFTFAIRADAGTPLPDVQDRTVTATSADAVSFGDITYTANDMADASWQTADGALYREKTFNYSISEIILDAAVAENDANLTYGDASAEERVAHEWVLDGVVYTKAQHSAHVTVRDDGKGTLSVVSVTYAADTTSATFTNQYEPTPAKAAFEGKKTMLGRNLLGGHYSFELYKVVVDENGDPVRDANGNWETAEALRNTTAKADGTFAGDEVSFDTPGSYYYVIKERQGTDAGVTYDAHQVRVTVEVIDDTKGALHATVAYDNSSSSYDADRAVTNKAAFTNKYEAEGVATPQVSKHVSGRNFWNEGESYSFTLTPVDGAPFDIADDGDSATVSADRAVASFGELTFNQEDLRNADGTYATEKTFDYTIAEVAGGQPGVTYDTATHTVHVKVKDANGTLSTEVTYDTNATVAPTFTNTYTAPDTIAEVKVAKDISGRDFWNANESYTFNITPDEGAPAPAQSSVTVTSGPDATTMDNIAQSFGSITFTQAMLGGEKSKTFSYSITEVTPDDAVNAAGTKYKDATPEEIAANGFTLNGVHYSNAVHAARVTVTDNGDGTLSTEVAYYQGSSASGDAHATFVNDYTYTPAEISLHATKEMQGRQLISGRYSAELVQADENFNPVKDSSGKDIVVRNAAFVRAEGDTQHGEAASTVVKYTEPGTYYYLIREHIPVGATDNGDGTYTYQNVRYDSAVYHITTTITDNGKGELVPSVTRTKVGQDGSYDTFPNFVNKFEESIDITPKIQKSMEGRSWLASDSFTFTLEPGAVTDAAGAVIDGMTSPMPASGGETATVSGADAAGSNDNITATFGNVTFTQDDLAVRNVEGAVVTYDDARTFAYSLREIVPDDAVSADDASLSYAQATEEQKAVVVWTKNGVTYDSKPKAARVTLSINPSTHELQTAVSFDQDGDFLLFKNSFVQEYVAVDAVKHWADNNNSDKVRPATVTMTLQKKLGSGEWTDTETVQVLTTSNAAEDDANTWRVTKDGLPKYEDNQVVSYRFVETDANVPAKYTRGDIDATDEDGSYATTNTHVASAQVTVTMNKVLTGRAMKAGEFAFHVETYDETTHYNGRNDAAAASGASSTVTMEPITFTYDDMVDDNGAPVDEKDFDFLAHEVAPDDAVNGDGLAYGRATDEQKHAGGFTKNGIIYSAEEFNVKIHVVREGDHLVATVTSDGPEPTFHNEYVAKGATQLTATKVLANGNLAAGQFTFNILDADGKQLYIDATTGKPTTVAEGNTKLTATNAADGSIEFSSMAYDQTDVGTTFRYQMVEQAPVDAEDHYIYDTRAKLVDVTVTDNGDGTLKVTPSYVNVNDPQTFNNAYNGPSSEVEVRFDGMKNYVGGDLNAQTFEFSIERDLEANGDYFDEETGELKSHDFMNASPLPITDEYLAQLEALYEEMGEEFDPSAVDMGVTQNDTTGAIDFGTVNFTRYDLQKPDGSFADRREITYLVNESPGDNEHTTYDESTHTIKVVLRTVDKDDTSVDPEVHEHQLYVDVTTDAGETYTLPAGEEGADGVDATITNSYAVELPFTGQAGIAVLALVGLGIIVASIVALRRRTK